MDELLALAARLESLGIGSPWSSEADRLAHELGVRLPSVRRFLSPELVLALHHALAERVLEKLGQRYRRLEHPELVELSPQGATPGATIVGLHGADDRGPQFAAVFGGVLDRCPLRLLTPSASAATWTRTDVSRLQARIARYTREEDLLVLVGFSAGANAALELRRTLAPRLAAVVAVSAAPSVVHAREGGAPTLYVHGTEDRLFSHQDLSDALAPRSFEDYSTRPSELITVPGFGHGYPYRVLRDVALPWILGRLAERSGALLPAWPRVGS